MKRRRERMDFFAVLEAKKANAVKPKSKDNDDEVEGVPTDDDEPEDEEPPTDTDDEDNTEPEEAPTDEDEEPPADTDDDTPQETNEPEPKEPPADDDTEETPPADDTEEEPPTDEDNPPGEEEPPVDDDTGTDTEEAPTDEEEPPTDDAGGEDPEATDGDTQTDDTGGDEPATEEPETTTPSGDMGNGLDPKQLAEDDKKNNILHLRTNFINLYKEVDNFIYRISEGSIDNVIISATYRSVKENLIKIKNSIYTYISRYYDITDYDINLYNYSEFLEAIRINLAMVKVANNCDDDKK